MLTVLRQGGFRQRENTMFPIGKASSSGGNEGRFTSEELRQVREIFDALVEECGLSRESEEAENMASAVLRLYASGQHDPVLLKAMLAPAFTRRRRSHRNGNRKRKRLLKWEV